MYKSGEMPIVIWNSQLCWYRKGRIYQLNLKDIFWVGIMTRNAPNQSAKKLNKLVFVPYKFSKDIGHASGIFLND